MTAPVVLPLWALLLLVASAPFTGWLGVRHGAKQAITLCSSHWECAMKKQGDRNKTTQELEEQLQTLRAAHPDLARMSEAMDRALKDTGEGLPVVPEEGQAIWSGRARGRVESASEAVTKETPLKKGDSVKP
jgi:hypothetical protein